MEFTEVMKQKKRMCEKYNKSAWASCERCGLYRTDMTCNAFIAKHSQEAEQIITDWASKNPIVTNRDKLEEVFGIRIDRDFSNCDCAGFKCDDGYCETCRYKNFWNKEYKEQKEV